MARTQVYKGQFSNVPAHTNNEDVYCFRLYVEPNGRASAKIYGQATSTGNYDWWVGVGPCPVKLYVDGRVVYDGGLQSFGLIGSGYDGSLNSDVMLLATVSIEKTSTMRVTVDCSNKPVISNSWTPGTVDSGNFTNWPGVEFLAPPKLGTLTNYWPYDNKQAISKNETSIAIQYTRSGGDAETAVRYNLNGGGENNPGHNNPFSFGGLTAGTSYKVGVKIGNDAGWTGYGYITIRTLHKIPTATITLIDRGLEDFTIRWSSDKDIQEVQYSLDGSSWISYKTGLNEKSGDVKVSTKNGEDLYPATKYTIKVRLKSTTAYDYRWSNDSNTLTITTDDRARLTDASPRNLVFADDLHILKNNESGNKNQVKISVGNPYLLIKTMDSPVSGSVVSNDYNIPFTQAELDNAYKKYLNPADITLDRDAHNKIQLKITLITFGRTRQYPVDYIGQLILTGNAKTANTRLKSDGTIRRGKIFTRLTGETEPRRGIARISTAKGTWRRGI